MVRDKFYGGWWSDMGLMFRLTYFVLQTLLTPFHSAVYQVFYISRHGCQMATFDCARVEGVGAQSKERKGSNFAA